MTDKEIIDSYKRAVNKDSHIRALARLTNKTDEMIILILGEHYIPPTPKPLVKQGKHYKGYKPDLPEKSEPPPPPVSGSNVSIVGKKSPKKEKADWSKLFDEMASGESVEYLSDKYCISVGAIKRMKSRIENKKAKDGPVETEPSDYTELENQEPEDTENTEKSYSGSPYTMSDDYRASQIIRLVKEDDSKEIKRLAGNLAVAINTQYISRELKVDLKYGKNA